MFLKECSFDPQATTICFCYMEDAIIGSRNESEHVSQMKQLFEILNKNIVITYEKCQFTRPEIEFLDHVISERGISVPKHRDGNLDNITCICSFAFCLNITINSPDLPYTQAKRILVEAYKKTFYENLEQAFQEKMSIDEKPS